jgi:hypothetical protein
MARKPGSIEYPSEIKLYVAMASLLLLGKASSIWNAAQKLAPQAGQRSHGTSAERRTRRLYEGYRDREPTWLALAMKDLEAPRSTLAAFRRNMMPMLAHASWIRWRASRINRSKNLS